MHFTHAKGILSAHNRMNMYRGCTHGCIYCDSRSKCYQFTHDFEDIEVKINAPELLEKALISKRNKCESHNVMHNLSWIFSYMNEIPRKIHRLAFSNNIFTQIPFILFK